MNSLEDLDRASQTTLQKATSGKISLSEALAVSSMIEDRRRVLETQDLERRLRALENADGRSQQGSPPEPNPPNPPTTLLD